MMSGDALNEAVKIIESKLKEAGIPKKRFRVEWWTNNGSPAMIYTFPNDFDENGSPIINDSADTIEIYSPLNIDKIDSVEAALIQAINKVRYNQSYVRKEGYCNFEDDKSFEWSKFKPFYDKVIEVLLSIK